MEPDTSLTDPEMRLTELANDIVALDPIKDEPPDKVTEPPRTLTEPPLAPPERSKDPPSTADEPADTDTEPLVDSTEIEPPTPD
jgi:hypothetical protein